MANPSRVVYDRDRNMLTGRSLGDVLDAWDSGDYVTVSAPKTTNDGILRVFQEMKASRGKQPDELALPVDGALRGDVPLSSTTNESEEF